MIKNVFKFSLVRVPAFNFSRNNVFRHACAAPLTILMSNLEEDMTSGISGGQDRVKSSLQAVTRLSKIISSVVSGQNFNEKFKVRSAVNEVLCLMRGRIEKDYLGSKVLISKDLSLVGNKLYFQEALVCILNNSIEAYKEIDQKPVSFIVRKVGDYLRVDAIDYASGMSLILQKLILLKGITTKKSGSGLGISFAKKTIENIFAGRMMIRSAVSLGTHVTLIIPLKKPCSRSLLLS